MNIITKTEQETFNFAKNFSKKLKSGKVIGLIGDLGAGKTIFSKGIAEGLGYKKNVTSPTFVLMKIYTINNKYIKTICHIDAYRIKTKEDLFNIGATEYFKQKNTITIIEWANNIINILPLNSIIVKIKIENNFRKIKIENNFNPLLNTINTY